MKGLNLLIVFFTIGCNSQSTMKTETSDLNKYNIDTNILIVKSKCAVIYNPDTLKIKELKKSDSNGFYISTNDVMFYISQIHDFLVKKQINVIETKCRYIDFYKDKKIFKQFDLSGIDKTWGLILYNGIDKPIESDLTNFELDFNKIMKE